MNEIISKLNDAVKKLYEHVGFVENWVICPIDDCTEEYWRVDKDTCTFADSKEQFNSDGDYYQDDIYKQRHYKKWVYEGKELTMVMCDPHTDGVKWFRVFDNKKRM